MKDFKIMEDLENENSTNKKMELLEKEMTDNIEEYLRITFGDVVLNVASKVIENAMQIKSDIKHKDIGLRLEWWKNIKSSQSSLLAFSGIQEHVKEATFSDFKSLFKKLQDVSGLDLQRVLREFFEECSPRDSKWYARCLIKNLSSGMSLISINKVFKKLGKEEIKTFELSLCSASIDCANKDKMREQIDTILTNNPKVKVEPKYDGIRLVISNCYLHRKKKETEAISRNGIVLASAGFLTMEFDRIFKETFIELDGELIAKDFQTLMTTVQRKNDLNQTLPREYMVFDILTKDGNDLTYLSYNDRRKILEKLFEGVDSHIIKLIKQKEVTTTDEVIEIFNKSVSAGYEGIIIKNDSEYTRDRENWWKMKPVKTADLIITSLNQEGTGRWAGKISSMEVSDASGIVTCHVGAGLDDETIKRLNINVSQWLGKIVEIRYDCVTNIDKTGKRSLRFPRFVKFRFDKDRPEVL